MRLSVRSSSIFVIVAILSVICGVVYYRTFGPSAKIVVPLEPIEFGPIPLGKTSEREVRLTNQGANALRILSLHTDCGCLRAYVDKDFVPAGESFTIHVEADGVRLTPSILQSVRILSNALGSPHILTISHQCVPENLTVHPPQVSFGRIEMDAESHIRSCQVLLLKKNLLEKLLLPATNFSLLTWWNRVV